MASFIAWFQSHSTIIATIFGVIVTIDHALASIPGISANSTYQGITSLIDTIFSKIKG